MMSTLLLMLATAAGTAYDDGAPSDAPVILESPERPDPPPRKPESGMGGGMGRPGYNGFWFPSRPVEGTTSDLGVVRQSLAVGAPVWIAGSHRVILNASVRNELFDTDAILPDTRRPFPNQLWNVSLGVMYAYQFDNGWSSTVGVNVGSASDKPFHSIDEMTAGFLGSLRVPTRNERDSWLFSVMYSPTSNFNFPIPGIAYAWKPSDELHVTIGIPFFVMWKPAEDWTVNLSYFPVTNVKANVAYRITEQLSAFSGFEWLYEAYFLADRADRDDRFISFEKRLLAGLRWNFAAKAAFDVQAGYAFDRVYGVGQNQLGNLSDQVDVAPGAFVGAGLSMRY